MLDGPEIGIKRTGELQIRTRPPVDIGADLAFEISLGGVVGGRGEGVEGELGRRLNALNAHGPQGRHKARRGAREGRNAPALIQIGHLPRGIECNSAVVPAFGHGHHGPGQEQLCTPAVFGDGAKTVPGPIPLITKLTLREHRSIGQGVPKGNGKPVAKKPGPRRVHGDGKGIPGDALISRREARH